MRKTALTMAALLALSGCASLSTDYRAAVGVVQADVRLANDNAAATWAAAGCAIPYGEVVRNGSGNPNFPKAMVELCGAPGGYVMVSTSGGAALVTTTGAPQVTVVAPTSVAASPPAPVTLPSP